MHDLALLTVMYLLTAFGVTVGFHRMLTHRSFRTSKPVEYLFAALGLDGRPGPGHQLGRRPPQAPRAHRRGGRPAQPARRARARASRAPSAGCCTRTSAGSSPTTGARSATATPRTSSRTAACARSTRRFAPLVLARAPGPVRARLADHRRARGWADRAAVGRPGAHLPAAPRDLVDQLDLPLLRSPPLRRRGPLDQRVVARAAEHGRGVAPQPPHVPPLGQARPRPLRARPVRAG